MSSDIVKEKVYDSRVYQHPAKFEVTQGGLSVSTTPFSAVGLSASQQVFNIYSPSENVYIDRGIEWSSTMFLKFTVTNTVAITAGNPLCTYGQDIALCAFPLNSAVTVMQATINDVTVSINSSDVLKAILRLTDYKKNRTQRTCPTMLDRYVFYGDGSGLNAAGVMTNSINNPTNSFASATDYSEDPNGAFLGFQWTDSAGVVLPIGPPATYTGGGAALSTANAAVNIGGVPCASTGNMAAGQTTTLYCKFTSTEKLVLSPFTFSDSHEWDVGLSGINNIALVCNMGSPSRLIRNNPTVRGIVVNSSSIDYNASAGNGGVSDAQLNVTFITPPLSLELPSKNIVPFTDFPRYISQNVQNVGPGATVQLQSPTITLPMIPDALIIFAKVASYSAQEGDWVFPLANRFNSLTKTPIQVQFDNYSGLLSSWTTEEIFAASVRNGLDVDWNTFSGVAASSLNSANASTITQGPTFAYTGASNAGGGYYSAVPSGGTGQAVSSNYAGSVLGAGKVALAGAPIVLKFGQDIALSTGQAPSLVGNFTLQLNMTIYNPTNATLPVSLFIVTANSGFVESIRGSTRVLRGLLSEQDVISAPVADAADASTMARYVGNGFLKKLANRAMKAVSSVAKHAPAAINAVRGVAQRANEVYQKTKPQISALKAQLPPNAAQALSRLGYGMQHDRYM